MSRQAAFSKVVHVALEPVLDRSEVYDTQLARFRPPPISGWWRGRLTLTGTHLAFAPGAPGRGARSVSLDLDQIETVEATDGRGTKIVSFRTESVILHVRVLGATALAKRVAISVAGAKRGHAGGSPRSPLRTFAAPS